MDQADNYENQIKKANDKQFAYEQGKIPYFYNDAKTDTLDAKDFIHHCDTILSRGTATADVLLKRVVIVLKGKAQLWYEGLIAINKTPKTYQEFRTIFVKIFNIEKESYEACTEMGKLQQKKDQSINGFFDICATTIDKVYRSFSKPDYSAEKLEVPEIGAAAIPIADAKLLEIINRTTEDKTAHDKNQLIKQFFIMGLLPTYRSKIMEKKDLDIEQIRDYACDLERIENSSKTVPTASTSAIEEEEEENVTAVRQPYNGYNRGQNRGYRGNSSNGNNRNSGNNGNSGNWRNNDQSGQQNNRGNGNNYRGQSYRGGNQNKNQTSGGRYGSNAQKTIVCWFCSKPGHIQTKCLARLNSNKPLNKSNNTVFTINGKGIIPENGITEEIIQKLTEAKIQGFNDESDFQ